MTLEKAIEILAPISDVRHLGDSSDVYDAIKLGIEALKQVKESRFDPSTWEPKTLPGETEF